jgi:hypothetical protein
MKNLGVIASFLLIIVSCDSTSKTNLDGFLIGGEWCGESELAGGEICLQFLDSKAYLTDKGVRYYNPLDYEISTIDEVQQTITWEFVGEGTLNVFKIISQDTIEFQQKGAKKPSLFVRTRN